MDVAELDEGLEPDEYVEHVAADAVGCRWPVGPDTCPLKLDLLAAAVGLMKAKKQPRKSGFHFVTLKGSFENDVA